MFITAAHAAGPDAPDMSAMPPEVLNYVFIGIGALIALFIVMKIVRRLAGRSA